MSCAEVKKLKRHVRGDKIKLDKVCERCYAIKFINRHEKGCREVLDFYSLVWRIGDFWNKIEKSVKGGTEVTVMLKRQWLDENDHCRLLDALIEEKIKESSPVSSFGVKEQESVPLDQ
jgi:hypothetical protein